ncbi:MAG: hypothetical protein ACYTDY_12670, partial [Planctomycetota bacterium]
MELARPEALLLALPAWALVVALAVLRRGGPSRLRIAAAATVRCAVLLLLVVALAGPHRSFVVEEAFATVLVPDASGSVSPEGRALSERHRASLAGEGSVAEIPFGTADGSDPRPALLRAAAADGGRTVLATDGHVAPGSAAVLADLRKAGHKVGVLPLETERGESARPRLAAPVLHLPPAAREDEPLSIRVAAPGAEEVVLLVGGELLGKAAVEGGVAAFPDLTLPSGRHLLVAVAERPGARAAALEELRVEGPLRVLVLGAGPDAAVARALSDQGIEVRAEDVAGPGTPDLGAARVVVALPRYRLPAGGEPLLDHVRRGGGLLVASGPPPGLSRYRGQEVADLLPAEPLPEPPEAAPPPEEPPPEEEPEEGARPAEVEKEAATLTLLLVLDRSGSMRGEKTAMARAACVAAARALDPGDRIGVLAFNETHEWIRRPGPA